MVLQDFLFLDENSGLESNIFDIGDRGKYVTFQVTAVDNTTIGCEIYAIVDSKSDSWVKVASTNAGTIETAPTMNTSGIYRLSVNGLKKIKVKNTATQGKIKVFGRLAD